MAALSRHASSASVWSDGRAAGLSRHNTARRQGSLVGGGREAPMVPTLADARLFSGSTGSLHHSGSSADMPGFGSLHGNGWRNRAMARATSSGSLPGFAGQETSRLRYEVWCNLDYQSKNLRIEVMNELSMDKISELQTTFERRKALDRYEFIAVMQHALRDSTFLSRIDEDRILNILGEMFERADIEQNQTINWDEFSDFLVDGSDDGVGDRGTTITHYQSAPAQREIRDPEQIEKAVYLPGLQRVITCGTSPVAKLWNPSDWRVAKRLTDGHYSSLTAAIHLPQHSRIITASADRHVVAWDDTSAQRVARFRCYNPQLCFGWNAEHNNLYSGSTTGNICTWDPEKLEMRPAVLRGHRDWVMDLLPISELGLLVSCSLDSSIKLWDLSSQRRRLELNGHRQGILSLGYSETHRLLLSAGMDREIYVWNPFIQGSLHQMRGHEHALVGVQVVPNSCEVVSADVGGTIKVWDIRSYQCVQTLHHNNGGHDITALAYDAENRTIITLARHWHLWKSVDDSENDVTSRHPINRVAYNPVFRSLSVLAGHELTVWDARTGHCISSFPGFSTSELSCITFDHRRRVIIVGDVDGRIGVFNYFTGSKLSQIDAFVNDECAHLFNMQRKLVCCISRNGHVRVYDMSPPKYNNMSIAWTCVGETPYAAYSPRTGFLATGGSRHCVQIWRADQGLGFAYLNLVEYGYRRSVNVSALLFADDIQALIAHVAGDLFFWSVGDFQPLLVVQLPPAEPLGQLVYMPSTRTLVTESEAKVRVYRLHPLIEQWHRDQGSAEAVPLLPGQAELLTTRPWTQRAARRVSTVASTHELPGANGEAAAAAATDAVSGSGAAVSGSDAGATGAARSGAAAMEESEMREAVATAEGETGEVMSRDDATIADAVRGSNVAAASSQADVSGDAGNDLRDVTDQGHGADDDGEGGDEDHDDDNNAGIPTTTEPRATSDDEGAALPTEHRALQLPRQSFRTKPMLYTGAHALIAKQWTLRAGEVVTAMMGNTSGGEFIAIGSYEGRVALWSQLGKRYGALAMNQSSEWLFQPSDNKQEKAKNSSALQATRSIVSKLRPYGNLTTPAYTDLVHAEVMADIPIPLTSDQFTAGGNGNGNGIGKAGSSGAADSSAAMEAVIAARKQSLARIRRRRSMAVEKRTRHSKNFRRVTMDPFKVAIAEPFFMKGRVGRAIASSQLDPATVSAMVNHNLQTRLHKQARSKRRSSVVASSGSASGSSGGKEEGRAEDIDGPRRNSDAATSSQRVREVRGSKTLQRTETHRSLTSSPSVASRTLALRHGMNRRDSTVTRRSPLELAEDRLVDEISQDLVSSTSRTMLSDVMARRVEGQETEAKLQHDRAQVMQELTRARSRSVPRTASAASITSRPARSASSPGVSPRRSRIKLSAANRAEREASRSSVRSLYRPGSTVSAKMRTRRALRSPRIVMSQASTDHLLQHISGSESRASLASSGSDESRRSVSELMHMRDATLVDSPRSEASSAPASPRAVLRNELPGPERGAGRSQRGSLSVPSAADARRMQQAKHAAVGEESRCSSTSSITTVKRTEARINKYADRMAAISIAPQEHQQTRHTAQYQARWGDEIPALMYRTGPGADQGDSDDEDPSGEKRTFGGHQATTAHRGRSKVRQERAAAEEKQRRSMGPTQKLTRKLANKWKQISQAKRDREESQVVAGVAARTAKATRGFVSLYDAAESPSAAAGYRVPPRPNLTLEDQGAKVAGAAKVKAPPPSMRRTMSGRFVPKPGQGYAVDQQQGSDA